MFILQYFKIYWIKSLVRVEIACVALHLHVTVKVFGYSVEMRVSVWRGMNRSPRVGQLPKSLAVLQYVVSQFAVQVCIIILGVWNVLENIQELN